MTTLDIPTAATRQTNEVILISHSNLIYWWPAIVIGYIMALITYFQGSAVGAGAGVVAVIHPSNNPGLLFIASIIALIVFSNARLRGIYSVVTLVSIAFITILFAWLGWWDEILSIIPQLSAKANVGFYVVFSTTLLIIWLASVFIFDRLSFWRIRPGQFTEVGNVGGGSQNYNAGSLRFERREQDYFRHVILGLGAADVVFHGKDFATGSIVIPNVWFVEQKVADIQRLIAIKPDA